MVINWQKKCTQPHHHQPKFVVNENMIKPIEKVVSLDLLFCTVFPMWSLPYVMWFGCCCCVWNHLNPRSTHRRFVSTISSFLLLLFFSSSSSASQFNVYLYFFLALFILVCKIKWFVFVRYCSQAHAKSEKTAQNRKLSVESKCTFTYIRECVSVHRLHFR